MATISEAIVAAALLAMPVSFERGPLPVDRGAAMPAWQKNAALGPLVASATECIADTVAVDSRFRKIAGAAELNDLIVDSMAACVVRVRAMIDGYDRLFGEGTGETFFMGPYLDGLPAAVSGRLRRER